MLRGLVVHSQGHAAQRHRTAVQSRCLLLGDGARRRSSGLRPAACVVSFARRLRHIGGGGGVDAPAIFYGALVALGPTVQIIASTQGFQNGWGQATKWRGYLTHVLIEKLLL